MGLDDDGVIVAFVMMAISEPQPADSGSRPLLSTGIIGPRSLAVIITLSRGEATGQFIMTFRRIVHLTSL